MERYSFKLLDKHAGNEVRSEFLCLLLHVLQALDKRRCKVSPTLKNVCFQCVTYIRRSSQTVLLLEQSVRRIRDLRFVLKDKYMVSCVL